MDRLTAFFEFRNQIDKSRVLTHADNELARHDVQAGSDSALDLYRQVPVSILPPFEYSQYISQNGIQNDKANHTSSRGDLGTVHRQVQLVGQTFRDRLAGRPLVAWLSMAARRPAQTGRPRLDSDRRRTERLLAGSNFNYPQADHRV